MVKSRKCSRSNRSGVNDAGKSKKLSVFDFNQDDERVEKDSHKRASKFKPKISRTSTSPIAKYHFLECFNRGVKTSENNIEKETLEIEDSDDDVAESVCEVVHPVPLRRSGDCESSCANLPTDHLNSVCSFPGGRSCAPENINLGGRGSGQILVYNDINLCPDCGDDSVIDLESSSASDLGRHEASSQEDSEHCPRSPFAEPVVIRPDLVTFGDTYSTSAFLTFSREFIKLEGSDRSGTKVLSLVWSISDVVRIKSFWCRKVETAFISLQLKSKNEEEAKINNVSELYFAVYGPYWCERQVSIESLDTRYKDIWDTVLKIDPLWSEFSPLQKKSGTMPEVCSPNCYTAFENFVYPQGEPDAVTLSTMDVELLRPASFINDTIIDFYVKYLEQRIEPEEKHRFHFFNSFFFRKLADLDKDPSTACDGRSAFHRVFRWTRKVNIFEKDYIFIPVNFSLHWSLVVICHPGEVAKLTDEEMSDSSKVPCILHLDSIRGSHKGLSKLFQRYLYEEWKERHSEPSEHISSKFLSLLFIEPELPQQGNSYDCGLFLLHYVERFLQQAPVNFSPFTTTFLSKDWFSPGEASSRRDHVKNLIYKMARCNTQKDPLTTDDCHSSCYTIEGDPGKAFGWDTSSGIDACESNFSAQNKNEEIQMISPLTLRMRHLGSSRESYLGAGALGPADCPKSLKDKSCLQHGQVNQLCNIMSPIEEEEATAVVPTTVKPSSSIEDASVSATSLLPEFEDVASSSDSAIGMISIISLDMQDEETCAPRALQVSASEETSKNDSCARSSNDLYVYEVEDSLERNASTDIKELRTTPLHVAKGNSMYEQEVESPYTKVKVVDSMEEERMIGNPKCRINQKGTLAKYLSKDQRV